MGAYGPPRGFYMNSRRVRIDPMYCTSCMDCLRACPRNDVLGATKADGKVYVQVKNAENCVGCCRCVGACLTHAIGMYLA